MSDVNLAVGCFGKLPFWREYLEAGTRSPASRELREWLRQGREMHVLESSSGDQQVTDLAFPAHLRVLLSLPGVDELLRVVRRSSAHVTAASVRYTARSTQRMPTGS